MLFQRRRSEWSNWGQHAAACTPSRGLQERKHTCCRSKHSGMTHGIQASGQKNRMSRLRGQGGQWGQGVNVGFAHAN